MEIINLPNSKNYIELDLIDNKKRDMVVIIPGGGYDHTSIREGIYVSEAFKKLGYNTLVLRYRENLDYFPQPMIDLMWAIDYARKLNTNKVIGIGFSAGANLLGLVSNYYMYYKEYNSRPDLDIICYPVIASDKEYTHKGSIINLLGPDNMSKENMDKVDIAKNLHKDFPPTFLWHTVDDEAVPLYNSLDLVYALKKNDVRFEYHIFPSGVHGLSMATHESAMDDPRKENKDVSRWFDMAMEFVKNTL